VSVKPPRGRRRMLKFLACPSVAARSRKNDPGPEERGLIDRWWFASCEKMRDFLRIPGPPSASYFRAAKHRTCLAAVLPGQAQGPGRHRSSCGRSAQRRARVVCAKSRMRDFAVDKPGAAASSITEIKAELRHPWIAAAEEGRRLRITAGEIVDCRFPGG